MLRWDEIGSHQIQNDRSRREFGRHRVRYDQLEPALAAVQDRTTFALERRQHGFGVEICPQLSGKTRLVWKQRTLRLELQTIFIANEHGRTFGQSDSRHV